MGSPRAPTPGRATRERRDRPRHAIRSYIISPLTALRSRYYALGLYCKVALLPYDDHDGDALHEAVNHFSFSTFSVQADVAILVLYGTFARLAAFSFLKFSRKTRFS